MTVYNIAYKGARKSSNICILVGRKCILVIERFLLAKAKFMKLDAEHIRFVLDCMKENTTKIRNIKQYLRAVLFNAPSTIGNYYTSLVAHDMASGALAPQEPHDPYSFKPGESL